MAEEEKDEKWKKIHKEYDKLLKEDGGNGGPFSDLFKKKGDGHYLESLKFKKEVLNPFKEENQTRFILERNITIYLRDKMGAFDLRSIYEKGDFICAHLGDLSHLPKNYQEWWHNHMVEED